MRGNRYINGKGSNERSSQWTMMIGSASNGHLSSVFSPSPRERPDRCQNTFRVPGIRCQLQGNSDGAKPGLNSPPRRKKIEDYNTVMKRMMRNPYEYHHDLG